MRIVLVAAVGWLLWGNPACQSSSEVDIRPDGDVKSSDYKLRLVGSSIAPLVYRKVDCGSDSVDTKNDIAISFYANDKNKWYPLENVEPDFDDKSVTGEITGEGRRILRENVKYDIRVILPDGQSHDLDEPFEYVDEPPTDDSDVSDSEADSDSDSTSASEVDSAIEGTDKTEDTADTTDTADTATNDTESVLNSDTDTCEDDDACDDTDSATADTDTVTDTDTGTEAGSDTVVHTDTGSATETDTETETVTDTGSDTDTYVYATEAVFDVVGFADPAIDDDFQSASPSGFEEANSAWQLQQIINNRDSRYRPLTIRVTGTIDGNPDSIQVYDQYNLKIEGTGEGAEFIGVGFDIRGSIDVVIRNLTIHHVVTSEKDAINIEGSRNVWIDHCEMYNDLETDNPGFDGLLDIRHESENITVSWNYFHDNPAGLIAGSDDDDYADADDLHVTWHHNIFENVTPGALSIRFGRGHAYNNLFIANTDTTTEGIKSRMGACMRAELNVFDGIDVPLLTRNPSDADTGSYGGIESIQNDFGGVSVGIIQPTCEFDFAQMAADASEFNNTLHYVDYLDYLNTVNATEDLPELLWENVGPGKY